MKQKRAVNIHYTIPAVCKAMDLLRILVEEKGENTIKGLALRVGASYATCYRILQSLILKDWVRPVKGGCYEISIGTLPFLRSLWQEAKLAEIVDPVLKALTEQLQLTTKVAVRQGDYAVMVARCESPRATFVGVRLGSAYHLTYGSTGAVLLSEMARDEIQEIVDQAPPDCWSHQKPADVTQRIKALKAHGWCADVGSYHPNINTISVPLFDEQDSVLAAMTVLGFPNDLPPQKLATPVKLLTQAARRAERELRKNGLEK